MIQLSFGNTAFQDVTGYRFAMALLPNGGLSARLQVTLENFSAHDPNVHGNGRGAPGRFLKEKVDIMPRVSDTGDITVGTPLDKIVTGLDLTKFSLAMIDSRVSGRFAYVLLDFENTPEWDVTSTAPDVAPELTEDAAGLVRLADMAERKPVRDIDSSGRTLSWRTDRCLVDDTIAWMMSKRGASWAANPSFRWYGNGEEGAQTLRPKKSEPAGMIFEELYGRFTRRGRFSARYLERCFGGIDGLSAGALLTCNLDEIVPLPTAATPSSKYEVQGFVEERVSIVYQEDVSFPAW